MGWLSLATRILSKVWRAGSKATSTLWHGGSTVLGAGGKALTVAAKNPKTTAATGVATFAGWRMLDHPEESLGTTVGKTVRGAVDQSGDFAHDAVNSFTGENTVEQAKDTANNVVDGLQEMVSEKHPRFFGKHATRDWIIIRQSLRRWLEYVFQFLQQPH